MSYSTEVLADSPVGFWKLDETSGTTAVNSGTGGATLDGTYTGTYTLGAATLLSSEPSGKSLSLAGAGYVAVPYNALINLNGAGSSLEAWASFTSVNAMAIISRENNFRMEAVLGKVRGLLWASALNVVHCFTNDNLDSSGAHHYVAAYGGPYYRVYVDGVVQTQVWDNVTTRNSDTSTALRIGQTSSGGGSFTGNIDAVALYASELSAARVAAHFTAGGTKVTFLNQQWQLLAATEMALTEAAVVSHALTTLRRQLIALTESATFTVDMLAIVKQIVALAESVTVTPTFAPQQRLAVAFADSATMTQQVVASRFVQMILAGLATVNDVLAPTSRSTMSLADIVTGSIILRADGQEMVGWIVNPNLMASTMLAQYDFTGFGEHKGRYYGLKPDGLYRLDGNTDAGTAIDSFISLGNRDFGTAQMKRVPHAYIGAATDGTMLLKVITNGQENVYHVRNPTTDMAEQRVDIGRGLRANYWNFELMNQNGENFDINTIRFMPVVLERRI